MQASTAQMRVAALTSGRQLPATRFRIRQHIPGLREHGIEVAEHCPVLNQHARLPGRLAHIRTRYLPPLLLGQLVLNTLCRFPGVLCTYRCDLLWLERSFLPGLEQLVHLTRAPRLLDVDDAIWLQNPLGQLSTKALARSMDAVVAGNSFLADWYGNYCREVHVVPTAVDCGRFLPRERPFDSDDAFVIGWTGTSGNFKYLKLIERGLARFLGDFPRARLLVMAERSPVFELIPAERVEFVPWSVSGEAEVLQRMDVGIMPLSDDDWTRGKCSFKMLQYMACALPVIVSRVGMNREVLQKGEIGFGADSEDEWYQGLESLLRSPALRAELGKKGRDVVQRFYDVKVVSGQLAAVMLKFN